MFRFLWLNEVTNGLITWAVVVVVQPMAFCLSLPGSNPSGALADFVSDVVNLNSYFRICLIYTAKESRELLSSFLIPTTNIVCIGNGKVIVSQKK